MKHTPTHFLPVTSQWSQKTFHFVAGFQLARSDSGDSGSEGFFIILVEYSLSSDYQGSGFRMRCRSVVDAGTARIFTVGELRAILGNLFSIQVASDQKLEIQ